LTLRKGEKRIDVDLFDARLGKHQATDLRCSERRRINIGCGAAAERLEQLGRLKRVKFFFDCAGIELGWKQAYIADSLDPNSTQSDEEQGTPIRIAARTDHQLETFWSHLFDKHTIEHNVRFGFSHIVMKLFPRAFKVRFVCNVQQNAAGLGFVRKRSSLSLERDGIADTRSDCIGFL